MEVSIQEMQIKDIPEVAAIENISFPSPWAVEAFKKGISSPHSFYLLAKSGRKIVGYIGLEKVLDEGHIANLAVHPEFRRQGIGKKLVDFLLKEGEKLGITRFLLEVRESNIAAQNLYAQFGFVASSRRKGYYRNPEEDAVVMIK